MKVNVGFSHLEPIERRYFIIIANEMSFLLVVHARIRVVCIAYFRTEEVQNAQLEIKLKCHKKFVFLVQPIVAAYMFFIFWQFDETGSDAVRGVTVYVQSALRATQYETSGG